ncbi:MAG: CsgG/HfaB family protein [Arcobacteraceae bacterium]
MKSINYFKLMSLTLFLTFVLQGCLQKNHDISQLPLNIEEKITIPKVCEYEYIPSLSTIAVMDFTNNSTFGKAEVFDSKSTHNASVMAGVIVNEQGTGLGGGVSSTKKTVSAKREVDARLSQTLTPLLESKIAQLSGTTLVARNDIEKINEELKLQDSGLLDSASAVEFGKLLGAKYIVTGSIDNVEINQRNHEGAAIAVNQFTRHSPNDDVKIAGLVGRVLTSFTDGILIKTTITVKILNVQTGQILYAQTLSDDVHIGKFQNPTYDVYIGGIKASIIASLEQIHYDFSNNFLLKGYITKIKTDGVNHLVQINLGKNDNIRPNQIFHVFSLEENIDPFSTKSTCDKIALPITLKVTQNISPTHSWLSVEKNNSDLKLLQLVESSKQQGGFFDF